MSYEHNAFVLCVQHTHTNTYHVISHISGMFIVSVFVFLKRFALDLMKSNFLIQIFNLFFFLCWANKRSRTRNGK